MKYNILHGDCRELMATLDENSVDAIVTDPPYELGFMGKSWDASGVAFDVDTWQQALRVLKPGGHLIAFSGSRTYHRMAVAIEDAGFEIRDQIMWVYGSGFPKSHNISKGLDKQEGIWRGRAGEVTTANGAMSGPNYERTPMEPPVTDAAQQWDGWGTALKPAHEPMVLARKPLIGTVANNVLTHGTGGLNIDGSRVGTEIITQSQVTSTSGNPADGAGGQRVNVPQIATGVTTQTVGRWPANFIHDGSDEVVGLFPDTGKAKPARIGPRGGKLIHDGGWDKSNEGFWPADAGGSAARFFYCAKASKKDRNEGLDGFEEKTTLIYSEKAQGPLPQQTPSVPSPRANHHPTVKPTTLMQYLVRLVTPPNGTVLDPFLGSGSTGKACAYEGFDFIGMELTAEYIPIAKARIEFALADKDEQLDL